jgi:2-C-methyl-D-erythritol 2,4-cyclodiphosphate synthase
MNCIMEYSDIRIGNGYDVHALKEGLPMWLCGVQIKSEAGFVAHSDGDVAIHALCDALLGAAALGDIGLHFPDNDDRWKGIDSKLLLKDVMAMLRAGGYELGNADITIALQAPKLRPYIDSMRISLAETIGTEPERISVKATTTEHLGFVGREEGCEVWATVIIFKK